MLHAGSSYRTITNELGTDIQGATVGGKAEYVRDELEANALCLKNENSCFLLVSCDLGGLEPDFTEAAKLAIFQETDIDPGNIIIGATHTGGPSVIPTNYLKPVDLDYLRRLKAWLVDLAKEVSASLTECQLAWGKGKTKIGYNRRCCWMDGTHTMHARKGIEEFTGMEGTEDTGHLALFVRDRNGKLRTVLHHTTSHPCTFYGADFYSADYPGFARQCLRDVLGNIPVLFFNGAIGDMGQEKMFRQNSLGESKEQKLARCGHLLAGETLRLFHEAEFHSDPVIDHRLENLELDVRLPDPERLRWAEQTLAKVDNGENISPMDIVFAHGSALLQKTFGETARDTAPIHAIRIGDLAFITQPTELFCRFGLDIKRRSPFINTGVFSICDGYRGYCPTTEGIIGGGYSGEPIYWCRLEEQAGYKIVDTAAKLLYGLRVSAF